MIAIPNGRPVMGQQQEPLDPLQIDWRQLHLPTVLSHRRMFPNAGFLRQPFLTARNASVLLGLCTSHFRRRLSVCLQGQPLFLSGRSHTANSGPSERGAYNNYDLSGG
jgi:hypothetical protein